MYIEKRKLGKNVKYYLVHSYREDNEVKKIRKYLGQNLNKTELEITEKKAENELKKRVEELYTDVFLFSLTNCQIQKLNKYDDLIKVDHLSYEEWQRFTEDFTYNTNAIEGSTVLKDEVHKILEKQKTIDPDELETKGVAKAIQFIRNTKEEFSIELIKELHRICFEGSKEFAGKIRTVEVAIQNTRGDIIHQGVHCSKLHIALKELVEWHKNNKKKFKPLVLAAIIHNQFEYIHPFQDGNGRVGRLLLNYILIKNSYPPISIMLKDRAEYYKTLEEYQKNFNLRPTLKFLIQQYKITLKEVTTKNKDE